MNNENHIQNQEKSVEKTPATTTNVCDIEHRNNNNIIAAISFPFIIVRAN